MIMETGSEFGNAGCIRGKQEVKELSKKIESDLKSGKTFRISGSTPKTRSLPATAPTYPIPLNTQPEGTTCEDCQRFRKEQCPYPDSNITMTTCRAFLIDLKARDTAIRNATLDLIQDTNWVTITAPDVSLARTEIEWIRRKDLVRKIDAIRRGEK